VHLANRQFRVQFPPKPAARLKDTIQTLILSAGHSGSLKSLPPLTIAAMHQGNYATIPNYLERELRYMDAGERGSKAPTLGHKGIPGYQ
jgi:hypothetical protein